MSPKWSDEEIILVYDLYLKNGRKSHSINHPELIALSEYLRQLPWHPEDARDSAFRNPEGTATKMQQVRAYDHQNIPARMSVHKGIEALTVQYRDNPEGVHAWADALRAAVDAEAQILSEPDDPELLYPEGKVTFSLHQRIERNAKARMDKLAQVKRQTGKLACEICNFDFEEVYGEHGRGFAECHHLEPLGSTRAARQTHLDELAVVCSNCHRMLHRKLPGGQLPTIDELRARVTQRKLKSSSI